MFQKQGVFRLNPEGLDRDALELELIDHGLVALEDGESDKGEKQLARALRVQRLRHDAGGARGAQAPADVDRARVRRRER